jgi:hypothetical protein
MSDTFAPFRVPRFRRLFAAYGVNATGDWLGEIALSILLLQGGGGVIAVGALWILARFVPALIAPFASALLHTRGPARPLFALHAAEAVLFGLLAVAAALDAPFSVLLTIAMMDGVLAVVARGLIKAAIVNETRPLGLHREGNALLNTAFTGAAVAGPAAAAALVATAGAPAALAVDAASFAVAAIALSPLAGVRTECDASRSPLAPLYGGLRHIADHPTLRRLLAMDAATCVFLAAILPVELVFITETLGGSEADFGAVITAWGAGALVAGIALPLLRRVPLMALIAVGMVQMIGSYAGMGASHTVDAVLWFSLVGGIGNGLACMAQTTAVQERAPDELQEPVNALLEALHTAAPGAGYALGTAVAALASPRAAYAVAALGALAALLIAAPAPRQCHRLLDRARAARPAPADATQPSRCATSGHLRP